MRLKFIALGLAALVAVGLAVWTMCSWIRWQTDEYVVFDGTGPRGAIIVPAHARQEEMAAARLLSETLGRAAGTKPFPIQTESRWRLWQRGIYVGETAKARQSPPLPGATRLERAVGSVVLPRAVVLRSRWPEDIVGAASWWLEKSLGAYWFIPGPLGVSVPRRDTLQLSLGVITTSPSFVSRDLYGLSGAESAVWHQANRLQPLFAHGHSMDAIFKPEDLARLPAVRPQVYGRKYVAPPSDSGNWQPNLTAPEAVAHTVEVLTRRLRADPELLSVSVAMNDSLRHDQSAATLEALAPRRYFRKKPDYANLVFGYTNKVARALAAEFPDRFVTAYAYDWTEDVPRFPVEPNVIPYLTADRSQWFDPAFAQQDRDLIKRWVAAGPKVVGIYDYYYGSPFLVPRPTLRAVSDSIPFAYEAGVRAFFAEVHPNWGLDGPKSWLATQLLWDAQQSPEQLLDVYYRNFWQETQEPMRQFFELCDRVWLAQPLPSYWLKYYKDEHQTMLYPPAVRQELRAHLDRARDLAKSDLVRARLRLVSDAFSVSEAFADFNEARESLSRLGLGATPDALAVVSAAQQMTTRREVLITRLAKVKAEQPLALSADLLGEYTRNDSRLRALWRLRADWATLWHRADFRAAFDGLTADRSPPSQTTSRELLADPELNQLTLADVSDFTSLDWVKLGRWRGHGEPFETRSIGLTGSNGRHAIRFAGCNQETISQWQSGQGGTWYVGTVQVRGKVSPGNMSFMLVSFLDGAGNHIGMGWVDRLPVGDYPEGVELAVVGQAPPKTAKIGLGLRVLNQVEDDYAEFSNPSLRELGTAN